MALLNSQVPAIENNVRTGLMARYRHVINNNYSDQLHYSRVMLMICNGSSEMIASFPLHLCESRNDKLQALPFNRSYHHIALLFVLPSSLPIALVFQLVTPRNYSSFRRQFWCTAEAQIVVILNLFSFGETFSLHTRTRLITISIIACKMLRFSLSIKWKLHFGSQLLLYLTIKIV